MRRLLLLLLALGCRDVPHFAYIDQRGQRFTDADLRGPWIADFVFTRCGSTCPLITARLAQLMHRIPDTEIAFVSFSVDPDHDTPAVLAAWGAQWSSDPRWHLLATDRESLRTTATALHAVAAGSGDALFHSDRFTLVVDGHVRGTYDSGDPRALEKLMADVTR